MSLTAPQPLHNGHGLDTFCCTEPELENWFRKRARKNQQDGTSRCFVVCDDDTIAGYYALAAGSVLHAQASGDIRSNMPDPIPVVVLGRLAVHTDYQGRGLGADLLKDAVQRSLRLSREMGIRALLCHAINANAKQFYLHHGFVESPDEAMTLMLNLAKLADTGIV